MGGIMNVNSLFAKLFISLALVFTCPIILIHIISSHSSINNLKEQAFANSIENLKQAETTLEQLETNVSKDSFRLAINSSINRLTNIYPDIDLTSNDHIEAVSHVLDILSDLVAINAEYHSIYLYLDDSDYTFTSNGGLVRKEFFYDTGWIEYYKENKNSKTLIRIPNSRTINYGGLNSEVSANNVITYIYPLSSVTNLKGELVINIKERMINSLINNSNYNSENYTAIVNYNGNFVTYPNSKNFQVNTLSDNYIKDVNNSNLTQGYRIYDIGQKKYISTYLKTNFSGWLLIGISSADALSTSINNTIANSVYKIIAIVMLGNLIAFILAKKLSHPFGKLVKEIRSTKAVELKDNEDEISIIYKVISTLINSENYHAAVFADTASIIVDKVLYEEVAKVDDSIKEVKATDEKSANESLIGTEECDNNESKTEFCKDLKSISNKTTDLMIEYISNNYKRDIGISDISEAVGLSYSHVRKVFKDELGESIVDYINCMRIKEAKQLLLSTDLSIKSIASSIGYNNDQSFTRFFKKYEGMTPGEYRNAKILSLSISKKGL
jgi:AraC-like DNA-binding protein